MKYRLLEIGEVFLVGDEIFISNQWSPIQDRYLDFAYNETWGGLPVRRKINHTPADTLRGEVEQYAKELEKYLAYFAEEKGLDDVSSTYRGGQIHVMENVISKLRQLSGPYGQDVCEKCNGAGRLLPPSLQLTEAVKCTACNGTGKAVER